MTDRPTGFPSTADLFDEHGDALRSCDLQFAHHGRRTWFSGSIRTVRCHHDVGLIRSLLEQAGDGAVLVVDGGGSLRAALLGDILAGLAVANGWSGLVISGAVRDTAALADLDIGIKALGTSPRSADRAGGGKLDGVVRFGGATFEPGALLVSDEDGVVVLPAR